MWVAHVAGVRGRGVPLPDGWLSRALTRHEALVEVYCFSGEFWHSGNLIAVLWWLLGARTLLLLLVRMPSPPS